MDLAALLNSGRELGEDELPPQLELTGRAIASEALGLWTEHDGDLSAQ